MFDSIFKSKWIPVSLQVFTFIVFMALIYLGWGISSDDSAFLLTLRNTNLANLIVWCFWWPGIIIVSVLFGRLWCTVCPMELMASILNRVGLKRKIPRIFRTGWAITLFYVMVLVIGVHTFAIHRVPHRMAIYMVFLFGLTIVVSLIFEKRAFCTFLCPVGHQLGLYASNACMELRIKDKAVCSSCNGKPCVNKNRDFAWYGRACQSYLFPGSLKDNRDCIVCTQCMKSCPHENVTFRFRRPFKDFFTGIKLNMAQSGFILIVLGFAFYEVTTEWNTAKALLLAPFKAINAYLHIPPALSGTMTALLLFTIVPTVLFILVTLLQSAVNNKKFSLSGLSLYLTAFIPLIASTHIAKSAVKAVSRFQYIPGALKDTGGVETARALNAGLVQIGGQWQRSSNFFAQSISIGVLIIGFIVTAVLLKRFAKNEKNRFPFFYIMLALAYVTCTAGALIGKIFFP
ncbi:MAG: 4Fe-4S binding protein [Candidatus Latescibacteria bacterium]|nr:4Fe-4S binding protein [Candidatus Latescibacterota bacterium]